MLHVTYLLFGFSLVNFSCYYYIINHISTCIPQLICYYSVNLKVKADTKPRAVNTLRLIKCKRCQEKIEGDI